MALLETAFAWLTKTIPTPYGLAVILSSGVLAVSETRDRAQDAAKLSQDAELHIVRQTSIYTACAMKAQGLGLSPIPCESHLSDDIRDFLLEPYR